MLRNEHVQFVLLTFIDDGDGAMVHVAHGNDPALDRGLDAGEEEVHLRDGLDAHLVFGLEDARQGEVHPGR